MKRILGIAGFIVLLYSIFFTTIVTRAISKTEIAGDFFLNLIVLLYLYTAILVTWNMLMNKTNKKSRFDRLYSTSIFIVIITILVKFPIIITLGSASLDIPWLLTFVVVPIIGWYDKKHFGSEE